MRKGEAEERGSRSAEVTRAVLLRDNQNRVGACIRALAARLTSPE